MSIRWLASLAFAAGALCGGSDARVACSMRPVEVLGFAWTTLAAQLYASCGLATDGQAYCWGDPRSLVMMTDLVITDITAAGGPAYDPTPVGGRLRYRALAVTSLSQYACAIATSGTLYCWGALPWHFRRHAMRDETAVLTPEPERVPTEARFVAITAGVDHVCALSAAGEILCFGANHYGQLGAGPRTRRRTPRRVPLPARSRSQRPR